MFAPLIAFGSPSSALTRVERKLVTKKSADLAGVSGGLALAGAP
jgi:hypothetical protein